MSEQVSETLRDEHLADRVATEFGEWLAKNHKSLPSAQYLKLTSIVRGALFKSRADAEQLRHGAGLGPRCPKCSADTLYLYAASQLVKCESCSTPFPALHITDFAQFFPSQERWVSPSAVLRVVADLVTDFAREGCDEYGKNHFCEQFGCTSFVELADKILSLQFGPVATITTGKDT